MTEREVGNKVLPAWRATIPILRAMARRTRGGDLFAMLFAAVLGLVPQPASADSQWLVFPQVTGYARDQAGIGWPERRELVPEVDVFASGRRASFRYLVELVVRENGGDLERLQLGWALRPGLLLWAGRFHNPLDYWHSQYHHGDFIQPSIAHPGIVAFERDFGPIPQHLVGFMLQGFTGGRSGVLEYVLALAAGPEFGSDRLVPVSLKHPGTGHHRPGVTLRLSWQPAAGGVELGAFAGDYRIPFADGAEGGVRQRVGGIYFNHEERRYRLTGALFNVRDGVERAGTRRAGTFQSGYLHGEYAFSGAWAAYGQWSVTHDAAGDPYLTFLPGFARQRATAGLRWDFARRQALKLELSRIHLQGVTFDELAVQWSAAFP